MRSLTFVLSLATVTLLSVALPESSSSPPLAHAAEAKPWCAPEVSELSDHVCFFDGGTPPSGRRTLVVYLHGMLATNPGFQYVQQRALANEAKALHFTVLFPTSPLVEGGYYWPTSRSAIEEKEPGVLTQIAHARADVVGRVGHPFDETFVVGFSSGAYYGSSVALRGALDVDGYIILAGGASWGRPVDRDGERAPVFVGVSARDAQTADDSRGLAHTLAGLHWPYRVEERNVGHLVDWGFMAQGIAWLRGRAAAAHAVQAAPADAGTP